VGSFAGIKRALGGLKNSLASAMLHQSLLSLLFITYWNDAVWRFMTDITRACLE
jgi:hypothetical protein